MFQQGVLNVVRGCIPWGNYIFRGQRPRWSALHQQWLTAAMLQFTDTQEVHSSRAHTQCSSSRAHTQCSSSRAHTQYSSSRAGTQCKFTCISVAIRCSLTEKNSCIHILEFTLLIKTHDFFSMWSPNMNMINFGVQF